MTALIAVGLALAAAAAGIACVVLVRRWRAEQDEVRRIRATFARYVAPTVVEELLSRKDAKLFSGREMRATILVCRIWNFAHLIENLTPEAALRYLNEFYAMAGSSIERHGGMLHHFLDDGVVGVFGVPLEDAQQEDHALRASINIVRLMTLMSDRWLQQNRRPLRVGIGVNTGNVIAGDAGFSKRREFTVVGPDVALAHRLQAATADLNAFIVASRTTAEPVAELYHLVPITGVPLNGVRSLLDASIVRGRKRADPLVLPKAADFATTVIEDEHVDIDLPLEATETVPFEEVAVDTQLARAAGGTPVDLPHGTPPAQPEAPLKTRRRPRADNDPSRPPHFAELPELRTGSYGGDDRPMFPDPPPPRATYEDHGGPPLPL